MSDQVILKTKEELAEEARLAKIVGTSQIGFIPTDDNVLLLGSAYNSALGFLNKNYDAGKLFTFKVIGFGNKVTDLLLDDNVKIMPGQEGIITIKDNLESFDAISKMLKGLKSKEYEEFIQDLSKRTGSTDLKFSEYFIVKRYAVLGIYSDDSTRNAIKYTIDNAGNVSNK